VTVFASFCEIAEIPRSLRTLAAALIALRSSVARFVFPGCARIVETE
jgi:hypothetical protein